MYFFICFLNVFILVMFFISVGRLFQIFAAVISIVFFPIRVLYFGMCRLSVCLVLCKWMYLFCWKTMFDEFSVVSVCKCLCIIWANVMSLKSCIIRTLSSLCSSLVLVRMSLLNNILSVLFCCLCNFLIFFLDVKPYVSSPYLILDFQYKA